MTFEADIAILTSRARTGDSAAQAQLGIALFRAGRIDDAVPWIEKAAAAEQPMAQNLLGVMNLNGLAVPLDLEKASVLLTQAARQGLKEASYTLAGLYANGFGVIENHEIAWTYLIRAGRGGHAPALRVAGLLHVLNRSDDLTGLLLLRMAAGQGDALAQSVLVSLLSMPGAMENLQEAGYWAVRANTGGMHTVKQLLSVLPLTSDTPPLPAQPRWEKLTPITPKIMQPAVLHAVVPDTVYEIDNTLPRLACDYLINLSAPRLRPSMVVDPETGKQVQNPIRSSHSMYFPPSMYDCVVAQVRMKMAELAHLPTEHAEPLSMLRYTPGQEYKPHQDYFVGSAATDAHTERQGGQRVVTVFAYLNDVEAGGETEFPEYEVKIHAGLGKAVKFMNLDKDGNQNPKTLHAGCPVIRGEKWLATFWFRQRPFSWNV